MAINSRSDITVGAAGIVLLRNSLFDLLEAIKISKKAFRRIKINYAWAFVYNVTLIPLAMGAFYPLGARISPLLAGIAMACSSVSVIMSSLLLRVTYLRVARENKGNIE